MSIHGGTAYPLALSMTQTQIGDFFNSKSFANYCKVQEARGKLHIASLSRFDAVIKGMGGLGKLLAAFAKRR